MEFTATFELLSDDVLLLALSLTRVAVSFLLLPLFSNELIPALIRNSIFVALAVLAIVVQPVIDVQALTPVEWFNLFAKEVFIGVIIGFFFGVYLWAFEAAGVIIDTQVGSSMAQIFDPLSGHEVTLMGEFLGLLVNFLFLAAGGLLLLTGAVLESFVAYPINVPLSELRLTPVAFFESEFSRFLSLTLMIASPIIVVTFIIDLCMGLMNRYAQQLNVSFLSMSLKSLAAITLLMMMLPLLVTQLHDEIARHSDGVDNYLRGILTTTDNGAYRNPNE